MDAHVHHIDDLTSSMHAMRDEIPDYRYDDRAHQKHVILAYADWLDQPIDRPE